MLALALAAPATSRANGDPASDFLLSQDVFFPFQKRLSSPVKRQLFAAVQRANKADYPVKVAIINTSTDLGLVPQLFGKPQQYAEFLGSEIGFQFQGHLVVAMPQGLGLSYRGGKPDPQAPVAANIAVPRGNDGTGLAASRAVTRLAPSGAGGGGGGLPIGAIAAIVATVLMLGGIATIVLLAHRGPPEDEGVDEAPPA